MPRVYAESLAVVLKLSARAPMVIAAGALLLAAASLLLGKSPAGSVAGLAAGIAGGLLVGLGFATASIQLRRAGLGLGAVGALAASLAGFVAVVAGALVFASALIDANQLVDLAMMLLLSVWITGSIGLIVYGYALYQQSSSPPGQLYLASALLLLAAPLVGGPTPAFTVLAIAGATEFKHRARKTGEPSTVNNSDRKGG